MGWEFVFLYLIGIIMVGAIISGAVEKIIKRAKITGKIEISFDKK